MKTYTMDVREAWTPFIDDKFQLELIDADLRRPAAVAETNILDETTWQFRFETGEPR